MPFGKSPEDELYKMICDHYDGKGIPYQRTDEGRMTLMIKKDRELPVNLFAVADTDPLALQICGRLPFKVPEESREMMVIALQAVNQRLSVGNFQMEMSSGTVDYSVSFPLVGIRFDEEWLENVLDDALYTITRRDEKILSLLRNEITLEEFCKSVR